MSDSPTLDEFMRHLQASLEESHSIEDNLERDERTLQLEIAIQESLIQILLIGLVFLGLNINE